jgi:glycerol-3-phosphate acyltransferase PlsY
LLSIVVACGIFIKHRGNIKRLIAGTENRVKL